MEFSEKFYNEADTTKSIKHITRVLKSDLKSKFSWKTNEEINELTEEILNTNGINYDNFNFVKTIEKIISEKLNDVSIDDNSNKNEKTIAGIYSEALAPVKKIIGFDYLYRTMKELYGKNKAKQLSADMYDYSIGLSDSTNILNNYCLAMDASKLITVGRDFGQLQSKPVQRISSYISALSEQIHQISAHLAGAIAVGTFFFDIAHLAYYKMNLSIEQVKNDPKCRKHFENEFQQFVHSVNHLSRNGVESPFVNISVFDKFKIRYLVENDLAHFYENIDETKTDDEWFDHLTDYIYEIQNIFLDFFDKGDPLNDGSPYRFPVCTLNFSKEYNKKLKDWVVCDRSFLEDVIKRDIFKYNIFTSEGTKIASCCFEGNETIKIIDENNEKINLKLKDFVSLYTKKEKELKINKEFKILTLNPENLNEEEKYITGVLKKKNEYNKLIKFKVNNETIKVTPDHIFLVKDKETGCVIEKKAEEIILDKNRYLIPV